MGLAVPDQQPKQPTFGGWMGSMWLYTILRFALFGALWGLLYLVGLHSIFGVLIAAALSIPLSYVLLSRPRARFAAQLEARVNARREQRADLDDKLAGEDPNSAE
jgi:predicted lipid-binding transport protein (Tim44 family)